MNRICIFFMEIFPYYLHAKSFFFEKPWCTYPLKCTLSYFRLRLLFNSLIFGLRALDPSPVIYVIPNYEISGLSPNPGLYLPELFLLPAFFTLTSGQLYTGIKFITSFTWLIIYLQQPFFYWFNSTI